MDNLFCGNLSRVSTFQWRGQTRGGVQRALNSGSGDADRRSGIASLFDRHQPGIVIAIIPES